MSMAPNFLVEVRDRYFTRVGQIHQKFLDLKYTEVFRGVGTWELKLPAEHPLLPHLTTEGSGIIITETWAGGSRVYSGRTQAYTLDQDASDPKGTWTISGKDDGVLAMATVVYPDPTQAADAQTSAYWNYTSNGESVMKQAVLLNAGASALVARKYTWLTVAASLGRGAAASANARFDVLGNLLEAAGIQSGLGWRFYQDGAGVIFDVTVPQDKTADVRLDIRNGGLESSQLATSAPTATTALVLGQGEGAARTVLPVTSTAATTAAGLWGLHWETTKDQRNTDDPTDLTNAGNEIITESGSTGHSMKIATAEVPGQRLGIDWGLGDTITVVIDGQETSAIVTQTAVSVSSAGVIKQATVGDPVGFDWDAKVTAAITHNSQRIDRLENYIDTNPVIFTMPAGAIMPYAAAAAPTGWLLAQGQAVSRTTYSALYAAVGTTYGAGDGSTTFNVPNLKGRVPVGIDTGQTEFDVRGETGGAKTHTLTTTEMPSHSHSDTGHSHRQYVSNPTAGGAAIRNDYDSDAAGGIYDQGINGGTSYANITSAGGGGAHNNLQPYIALHYIIKT